MALCAFSRFSTNPILWKAHTSRKRSTSRRHACRNTNSAPSNGPPPTRYVLSASRMAQSTPNFASTRMRVWPLEVAPRPIGGLCARALRFADADSAQPIGLEELLLRHAVDLPGATSLRESAASAVMMIPVPQSGVLENVEGEAAARATPHITELHITARLHDYIAAWPEGSSYLGFLFASADTPAEAENAVREAHAKLKFTLTPRLPVEHPATRQMID